MNKEMYFAALTALLVSLEARAKAASGYCLNVAMQVETSILYKQIDALKKERDSL